MQKSNRCGSNKNCFFILHSAFIICFGFGRAVSRILSAPCGGENHLSVQPIPGIRPLSRNWSGPLRDSLFGLAPDGVFRAASLALRAVVSYTTFSPLPAALAKHRRFNFLWHCPSESLSTFRPRVSQSNGLGLRGIAPCGVRTFLPGLAPGAILHPSKTSMNINKIIEFTSREIRASLHC